VLKDFLYGFEFVRMKPDQGVLKDELPPKSRVRVLSETGKQYALNAFSGPEVKLSLTLPVGKYKAEWISPMTGKVLRSDIVSASGSMTELASPKFETDIVLRIIAAER
jgi:hypothetical protein